MSARWSVCAIYPQIVDIPLTQNKDRTTADFFMGSLLSALTTLSFSDNVDLQRSAALEFTEITEKEVRQVAGDTLDPSDVQRAASVALGNLAVNGIIYFKL
jgi:vacuolar protein 8